jgi:Legume lectin domain
MRFARLMKTVLVGATALFCVVTASAQQVRFFPDFSSAAGSLQLNGSSHLATYHSAKVLRLTNGYAGVGTFHPETASAWFEVPSPSLGQQVVNSGFTTYFKFQIHTAAICCAPGDGFAFVVQTASSTALGSGFGGIGYAGIPNSLAVEFDTFQNPSLLDPNANHVAVQSCGTGANSAAHITGNCLVGSLTTGLSSSIPHLGVTCGVSSCADGVPHEAVIEYTPPASGTGNGTLAVFIDQPFIPATHTPCPNTTIPGCPVAAVAAINIPYNIDNAQNSQGISLAGGTSAWVGFTADQPNVPEAHDILAWEFTPHAPAQVTQVIPPGNVTADYVFGGHDMGVKYFDSFVNVSDPYLMTVTATPVSPGVFYQTRLLTQLGTPFKNEQCVVYLTTGGNCIVYSATCARQSSPNVVVPCPTAPQCTTLGDKVNCITFSTSFYTAVGITPQNADYLKSDPVGTNNWVSIFVSYDPSVLDGRTTGTGGSSSDFVATLKAFSKP